METATDGPLIERYDLDPVSLLEAISDVVSMSPETTKKSHRKGGRKTIVNIVE
ncbi:hypothetical protein ACLOJK_018417, partial [Asimina triloba]